MRLWGFPGELVGIYRPLCSKGGLAPGGVLSYEHPRLQSIPLLGKGASSVRIGC